MQMLKSPSTSRTRNCSWFKTLTSLACQPVFSEESQGESVLSLAA